MLSARARHLIRTPRQRMMIRLVAARVSASESMRGSNSEGMTMEPKTNEIGLLPFPFEVKATDEAKRTFSGRASTWDLDMGQDVIRPGAFTRTLEHWSRNKAKNPVPLMDWHGFAGWGTIRSVLGKMTEAEEVTDGLDATFVVTKGQDGDEALYRVRDGIVTGLSIGFRPIRWEIVERRMGRGRGTSSSWNSARSASYRGQ
jgi:HK97 family phage prohead protease